MYSMYLYHIVENIGKDLYLEIGNVKRYCNIYMIPVNVSHYTLHDTCIVAPRNVVYLLYRFVQGALSLL